MAGRQQVGLALAALAALVAGATHAFVPPSSAGSGGAPLPERRTPLLPSSSSAASAAAAAANKVSAHRGGSGSGGSALTRLRSIEELYSSADPDPNRRVLKLAFLAATRPKVPPKTAKEKKLDPHVWGRWKLVEESIDRPDPADLAKYGSKLKPTYSKFEEDVVFDSFGTVMLTKADTTGYGLGWTWAGLNDVYSAPTLRFRINRKGVGIDFDEYEDVNHMPGMSFYSGTFTDGNMDVIEGVIERNRDAGLPPDPEKGHVVVKVGTFTMVKIKAEDYDPYAK